MKNQAGCNVRTQPTVTGSENGGTGSQVKTYRHPLETGKKASSIADEMDYPLEASPMNAALLTV